MRGDDSLVLTGEPIASPMAEVFVSSYYIDRYPVTNRRYRECVVADACPFPASSLGLDSYVDIERRDYPVQGIGHSAASAFCAWDGGRRLPTEAEWEKAVRGPSPRTNRYPWDGTEFRCDLFYGTPCGYSSFGAERHLARDLYDGLPGTVSYYGTYLQYGGVGERVNDFFSDTYFASAASLNDPQGPASGMYKVARGVHRDDTDLPLTMRRQASVESPFTVAGFRCARSAP